MTWPNYSSACRKAVNDLLKRGGSLSAYRANKDYGVEPVKGSYAYRLERALEDKFKVNHAVVVNSGTAALHAALRSLNLNGGEVVTSPYTFSATAAAILLSGGVPVFADVDPYTFCITKETVKRVITKRTRAILPVHLFGGLADVQGLKSFGLPVVEDACQAVGARQGGVYSGAMGVAGAYSFNGGKNIPAGECGALVTNDPKLATQARLLMNHAENFGVDQIGLNYRPNEVTACIAYHGLLELEERNQRRQELAHRLVAAAGRRDLFGGAKLHPIHFTQCCDLPDAPGIRRDHVYYVYPFKVDKNRHRFATRMKRMGIPVGEGYITPHLGHYKAFRKYVTKPLPVVEELSTKTLCILSTLTPDKPLSYAEHVAACMRKALE